MKHIFDFFEKIPGIIKLLMALFIFLTIVMFFSAKYDDKVWEERKAFAVDVPAYVTNVNKNVTKDLDDNIDVEYSADYEYEYKGKKYQFYKSNVSSSTKVGQYILITIDSENPEKQIGNVSDFDYLMCCFPLGLTIIMLIYSVIVICFLKARPLSFGYIGLAFIVAGIIFFTTAVFSLVNGDGMLALGLFIGGLIICPFSMLFIGPSIEHDE